MFNEFLITEQWNGFDNYLSNCSRGLTTGFSEIDKKIIGLPGLVTIQGEPKCCKSTFAMNIGVMKALEGHPVLFLDKENGLNRTRLRMLSYLSDLTSGAIKSQNFYQGEREKYFAAVTQLKKLPIYYINETTKEQIQELIDGVGNKHNNHILLIADSLQSLVEDFKDRRASVDYWVFLFNELKMKYENDLTILVISEKRRDSYGQSSKNGGKESGSIEYKSEMVLDMYIGKDKPTITVDCILNRDGDTGIVAELCKSSPYTYKLTSSEFMPDF